MRFSHFFPVLLQQLLPAVTLGCLSAMAITLPACAAEEIFLDYGFLGRSLPITSLEAFAEEGHVDDSLEPYLSALSPEDRQEIQQLLSTPISELSEGIPEEISDPLVLSQWLYSPIGDILLATTGQMIQTRARQNGQQALRAAVILAADDPAGLSLMNVIRFYPTAGVRLNLPRILALAESLNTNIEKIEELEEVAIQQSESAAVTDPDLGYSALPVLSQTPQFEVVTRSLLLQDNQRDRTVPTDLYLPEDLHAIQGPIPVMVFSHGYGNTHTDPDIILLARSLASNGFMVAVPEHIGSNQDYQDDFARGLTHESFAAMEFIDRPLDIRFVLDTLEAKNDSEFQGRLQLDKVGLIGYSLGGYTALATAGATVDIARLHQQCDLETDFTPETVNISLLIQCRLLELEALPEGIQPSFQQLTDGSLGDERIGLVMAFAPLSNLFGESGLNSIQIPVVIMGGSYDVAAPIILEQLTAFQWLKTSQKYFYLAENISHTSELTRAVLALAYPESNMIARFNSTEESFFDLVVSLLIAHGKVHLSIEESYRPYLTSAYVETVSIEPTNLHLMRSFPDESVSHDENQ